MISSRIKYTFCGTFSFVFLLLVFKPNKMNEEQSQEIQNNTSYTFIYSFSLHAHVYLIHFKKNRREPN